MIGGKKILTNTFFLIISSVLNLGISLITTSMIARSIGPELYGRYTFALSYIWLFSVLANFGLISLFVREAASDEKKIPMIIDILYLKGSLAIVTIAVTIVSVHLLRYPSATITVIYILCVGLFFQILYESLVSVYQAREKIYVMAILSVLFRILSAIVVVVAIYSGVGFLGIVSAFSVANALLFLITLIMCDRDFHLFHLRMNTKKWRALIKQGLPFYLSALFTMFYAKINIVILSKLVQESDIGFYMASLNLVENLFFIVIAFNTSMFPALSRIHGMSAEALQTTYERMMKYLIILSAAVTAGTILVGENVILLIYGDQFGPSAYLLKILIFFWVFSFFTQTQSSLLFSIGKEKVQAKLMGFACFVSVGLTLVLVNSFGIIGAAYATVLTEALIAVAITTVLWKLDFHYRADYYLVRLLFAVFGMIVVVRFLLRINVLLAIAGGGICYLVMLFLVKVFDGEDVLYIRTLLQRGKEYNPNA